MSEPRVLAPQLLTDSQQLIVCYEAEDQAALKSLVPDRFEAQEPGYAFINQYWVPNADQLSNANHPQGWGAYSLTYLGMEIAGHDLYDGTATRWWTHYYNSSPTMTEYAAVRGIPTTAGGRTELHYLTRQDGEYEVGRYPFVGVVQEDFELVSLEFLDPASSVYGLRPKQPFSVKTALFTPKLTVCYPGGQQKLDEMPF
jgi:hypothetical protein